ncbi:hypothetical protein HQ560_06035 [bacterium]|nr:hypothetical protein [bacterium]
MSFLCVSDPEGSKLAFNLIFSPFPLRHGFRRACVLDTKTGHAQLVSSHTNMTVRLSAWAPLGRHVACAQGRTWFEEMLARERLRLTGRWSMETPDLMLYDAEKRQLLDRPCRSVGSLAWLDATRVAVQIRSPFSLQRGRATRVRSQYGTYSVAERRFRPFPENPHSQRRFGPADTLCPIPVSEDSSDGKPRISFLSIDGEQWISRALPPSRHVVTVSPNRRYALLRPANGKNAPGPLGMELLPMPAGTPGMLWEMDWEDAPYLWGSFSPRSGYIHATGSDRGAEGNRKEIHRIYDMASQDWLALPAPWTGEPIDVMFTPDERHLLYIPRAASWADVERVAHRLYVHDLAAGRTWPLPVRTTYLPRNLVDIHNNGVYFNCNRAAIYHIALDGTGLERVFPKKQPLTLAEFEAEATP